ncbi:cyclic nucleotide-binding domain-containing protein [Bacilliculturomica massiliensis]|uniref:hypothetical protein n=1 Tax=Bacilliculturomica massiliensis TaxID=1917867 RepID=UPI001031ADE1|nr:hypothetical protein [Bacilliculturomica massiliensis]
MEKYLDLLLAMPLFQGIGNKKDLAWVMKCVDGNVKEYRAGEVIFEKGEDVYFEGMIVSGIAQMEDGDKVVNIDTSKLIPIPYESGKSVQSPGRVTAKTDCRILFMRWIRLMKICNFECAFHKQLLKNLENLKSI